VVALKKSPSKISSIVTLKEESTKVAVRKNELKHGES
jgi:hypothetical protein